MAPQIKTYQDSLDGHRAVIVNGNGESLATMPRDGQYGTATAEEAQRMAQRFLVAKEHQGIDIEGGGKR